MTPRAERALIRFLLMWFRLSQNYMTRPQEYLDLENEAR